MCIQEFPTPSHCIVAQVTSFHPPADTKLTRAKALQDTKNEVSEFNIRYLFLANREPNISTCTETALQMHRRYKEIYPLIDKQANQELKH